MRQPPCRGFGRSGLSAGGRAGFAASGALLAPTRVRVPVVRSGAVAKVRPDASALARRVIRPLAGRGTRPRGPRAWLKEKTGLPRGAANRSGGGSCWPLHIGQLSTKLSHVVRGAARKAESLWLPYRQNPEMGTNLAHNAVNNRDGPQPGAYFRASFTPFTPSAPVGTVIEEPLKSLPMGSTRPPRCSARKASATA